MLEINSKLALRLNKDYMGLLLDFIRQCGQFVSSSPLQNPLPDPDDEPFLEAAIAGNVKALITGNSVHYPKLLRKGINIVSPAEFIEIYRKIDKSTEPGA